MAMVHDQWLNIASVQTQICNSFWPQSTVPTNSSWHVQGRQTEKEHSSHYPLLVISPSLTHFWFKGTYDTAGGFILAHKAIQ